MDPDPRKPLRGPVLGIEGTAHTLGVGIVLDEGGKVRVLANERAMVRPPKPKPGEAALGIHPREAAHHHAEAGPGLVEAALAKAGVSPAELGGIAFSQGPGLGPCLRVAATMARALALQHDLPLAGVNHCVAHLEIARALPGHDQADPMLLYLSGGNTQVLAFARGRYRVFGETLDVGLGNALDKFAREHGFPFPGGPEVERLAQEGARAADPLPALPYVVKGMDVSFAGVATAASRLVADGVPLPLACHAFQEHAFAAVLEVAERALAHTGRTELALGGGVACNARLQEMAKALCDERGASLAIPPRDLLVDNGAMIAWLGLRHLAAGRTTAVAVSDVRPYERTDEVDATWRGAPNPTRPSSSTAAPRGHAQSAPEAPPVPPSLRGAEATLEPTTVHGRPALRKRRLPKAYRHPAVDATLRDARTRDEANLLGAARRAGVRVPVLLDVDRAAGELLLERLSGPTLRTALSESTTGSSADAEASLRALGQALARLHAAGLVHGDPTSSNVLLTPDGLALVDFGLGGWAEDPEPRGVDLHLVEEALEATEAEAPRLTNAMLSAYASAWVGSAPVLDRLDVIRQRGRYK